ncbi:hypothetical protein QA600_18395 [Natronococcus sp. A-GB1]|uniref:hypothetical protein n=1 Tax=Natronococcus sp. A-GB1 TaxID=3037648 RepID=UPI00241C9FFB|nr:hypothetical protein [Natronococcus sp. A-GB1]MDG5761304.1 hypothetical protein [Natronococcus sp. A-GB1]
MPPIALSYDPRPGPTTARAVAGRASVFASEDCLAKYDLTHGRPLEGRAVGRATCDSCHGTVPVPE